MNADVDERRGKDRRPRFSPDQQLVALALAAAIAALGLWRMWASG